MPAVLRMNIQKNPGISQSLFVIPMLVRRHSRVYPKFSPALRCAFKLITITPIILLYQSSEIPVTPVPVVRDPSYSEGLPEYPPGVWFSPEIDASKFTLHILSDTPGVFQWLKYILLMWDHAQNSTWEDLERLLESIDRAGWECTIDSKWERWVMNAGNVRSSAIKSVLGSAQFIASASAKCNLVPEQHTHFPDTPVNITGAL